MHLQMMTVNDEKSNSDSDTSSSIQEPESHTRVGDDFQATTNFIESLTKDTSTTFKETLIWTPSNKLNDSQIEEYLFAARASYGYNIDQALAMLYWHNHDIERALCDMKNFVPAPDDWSNEDKILFEQAYLYHGKNFNKIRTVLPDKTQASLVNYYYMWKKTRNHKSLMDNLQTKNDDKDEDDDNSVDYGAVDATNICSNCDEIYNNLHSTPKGMLCDLCYNYWKRTGVMRPENVSYPPKIINTKHYNGDSTLYIQNNNINNDDNSKETRNINKAFRRPPKGIFLNLDELHSLTQVDQTQIFERLDNRIMSLKRQVQSNKQEISSLIKKFIDIDKLTNIFDLQQQVNLINNNQTVNLTTIWNQREAELAIQGLNKYGKDYNSIAQIIETKSAESVEAFYEYHKQYSNLDDILANANNFTNLNDLKSKAKLMVKEKPDLKHDTEMTIQNDDSSNDDVICI